MRYFDGQAWTNHFHSPDKAPDVGSWINNTFSVFARYWRGAAVIAFVATIVGNLVAWFAFRAAFDGVALVDEDLVGFSAGKALLLVAVGLFGIAWQGLGWLALNRYMQRAHFQAEPTVAEAVQRGLKRLPKYLGIALVLGLAFVLVVVLIIALAIVSPILGIFLILLAIAASVWVFVKLSFLSAALAACPDGTGVLRASADVSSGRFWGIAGRVIVFTIALGFASNIVSSILGEYGSAVDPDAVAEILQVDGDELFVDDFQFVDFFPSTGKLLGALLIMSILRTASTMISTSAFMRLYLDVGAPSEIEP